MKSIKIFRRNFLSLSSENMPRGNPLLFLLISVSKIWIGVGEYQDSPSKIICLTVPKSSVGETFFVALYSGIEKFWIGGEGGVIRIFLRKFFVSQCRTFS